MKKIIFIILMVSFNLASSDTSSIGFYHASLKLKSGGIISGYVGLIDSNIALEATVISRKELMINFGTELRVFTNKFIELDHPAKNFLSGDNLDWIMKDDIESKFYIADSNSVETVSLDDTIELEITSPVDRLKINVDISSQNEILLVKGNDKYLLTESKPRTFMIYEVSVGKRVYVFSYGNNFIDDRAGLYRYLNYTDIKFNPRTISRPTILKEGVYAIPIIYDGESI